MKTSIYIDGLICGLISALGTHPIGRAAARDLLSVHSTAKTLGCKQPEVGSERWHFDRGIRAACRLFDRCETFTRAIDIIVDIAWKVGSSEQIDRAIALAVVDGETGDILAGRLTLDQRIDERIAAFPPNLLAAQILADVDADPELRDCRNFSDLHDHCDANMLGGTEEFMEFIGRGFIEEGEACRAFNRAVTVINRAQELVSATLSGRP